MKEKSMFSTRRASPKSYTLSLHDALPISRQPAHHRDDTPTFLLRLAVFGRRSDRKSTRLNSSHRCSSYAVFCLKKKKLLHDPPKGAQRSPGVARTGLS